mmetsp:Transcript_100474/g.199515  ORF Transcript_100474/g.199515 Transcript_100474/m.199515 type:complete len:254 (+) Transcript_100474:915-1676(+)
MPQLISPVQGHAGGLRLLHLQLTTAWTCCSALPPWSPSTTWRMTGPRFTPCMREADRSSRCQMHMPVPPLTTLSMAMRSHPMSGPMIGAFGFVLFALWQRRCCSPRPISMVLPTAAAVLPAAAPAAAQGVEPLARGARRAVRILAVAAAAWTAPAGLPQKSRALLATRTLGVTHWDLPVHRQLVALRPTQRFVIDPTSQRHFHGALTRVGTHKFKLMMLGYCGEIQRKAFFGIRRRPTVDSTFNRTHVAIGVA